MHVIAGMVMWGLIGFKSPCDKTKPIPNIPDFWSKVCGQVLYACKHQSDPQQGYLTTPKGSYFIQWCTEQNIEDCSTCNIHK
jgi:hypothetical protein